MMDDAVGAGATKRPGVDVDLLRQRSADVHGSAMTAYGPDDARANGWANKLSQYTRWSKLLDVVQRSGEKRFMSMVDVGCGTGMFLSWLLGEQKARGGEPPWRYLGIDILPEMVQIAQAQAVPEDPEMGSMTKVAYRCSTVFDLVEQGYRAQFVLASGALSVPLYGKTELPTADDIVNVSKHLNAMFAVATTAVAANFLSRFARERSDLLYWHPLEIFEIAHAITPWVTLVHDYRDNDFAVYLFKEPVL